MFDIDWEAGGGKVRLPVLGGSLDQVADQVRGDGQAVYHEHRFLLALEPAGWSSSTTSWSMAPGQVADLNYRRFFTVNDYRPPGGPRGLPAHPMPPPSGWSPRAWSTGSGSTTSTVARRPALAPPGAAACRVSHVVAEKILEDGERLPGWPVAGTTGYEFLAVADGSWSTWPPPAPSAEKHRELTGADLDLAALALAAKWERLERDLAPRSPGWPGTCPATRRPTGPRWSHGRPLPVHRPT